MALPLSYNWKNLVVRKVSTAFTVSGVAVVVFVFTALMGFVSGLRKTLTIAGDDRNIIVLKQGATAESNSAVNSEELNRLRAGSGIAHIAPEYLTIAALPRRGDKAGNWANVPVRGVDVESVKVHDKVKLVEGESWEQFIGDISKYKVIVGKGAARQFEGLDLGAKIRLGFGRTGDKNNEFEIVGIFDAGGGVQESEIWAYGPYVRDVYKRSFFSSITVRATSVEAVEDVVKYAEGPYVQLTAKSEKAYFEQQTETTKPFIVLAVGLLIFMGIAAGFAIANNMYAMVAGRMREIAMLRAIGFSKGAVMLCFVIESLMLATLGGVIGALCALPLNVVSQDMIGGSNSFTAIVFRFDVSPQIIGVSLTMAIVLGFVGALFPALRAARTPIVTALRQA